ncbi:MAG: hypothetical protein KC944_02980 [Candidatus Omnitrophica bacterium]|nr:hypothetical protein [Candidatus Omnitrophota bacterium]MCA9442869.1 hypothetical protein [Candidatus Omnitrophota bacterium]
MASKIVVPKFPFWGRLLELLVEVVEAAEKMSRLTDGQSKKMYALDLVDRWYRDFGLGIPYVPRFVERRILRKLASDLIDAVVAFSKEPKTRTSR